MKKAHQTKYKVYLALFFICICSSFTLRANDGSYYGSGNQLIPISDADISVQKEILSITRNPVNDRLVDVSVYYEFFNKGKAKELTVGFEAFSAGGDADFGLHKDGQPYMSNFLIEVNNQKLPYQVSVVTDSIYYKNGVINALTQKQIDQIEDSTGDWVDFFYVYHFNAKFEPGVNIVKHTYSYQLSGSVEDIYSFGYVLTAATRWSNKQIDDFTLSIDMGNKQLIYLPKRFFNNTSDWTIEGVGRSKSLDNISGYFEGTVNASVFFINQGKLVFKKKNFSPMSELHFYSPRTFMDIDNFNYKTDINFPYNYGFYFDEDAKYNVDYTSAKILRNMPFAYNGYVFKDPVLQQYYEQQFWYYANPNYTPDLDTFSEYDQEWIKAWGEYPTKRADQIGVFDYKRTPTINYYQFIYEYIDYDLKARDEVSTKILRNLPFAHEGYVFTNPDLEKYFDQQDWYKPNPSYTPKPEKLSEIERRWITKWKE